MTVPCPPDSALPVLPACLDSTVVLEAVRAGLHRVAAAERERWREARLLEALYHPGRYVRVVYALMEDPATTTLRAWPEGQLVYLHAPVRLPISGRGVVLEIDGQTVEAYAFPNDRRLRGLRNFTRRDLVLAAWKSWNAGKAGDVDAQTLQRKLVRYVPEQKCVVRLRAEWVSGDDGPKPRRIAVRSCSPVSCTQLAARHEAFTANGKCPAFLIPKIVGVDAQRGLLGMEWLRGDTLVDALRNTDERETMARVAQAICRFHHTAVAWLPRVTSESLAVEASDALTDLRAACPELRDAMRVLDRELPLRLARVATDRSVTLHNDLHWNQFSIKPNRLALLDLERMAVGDELIDVANLATQIEMLGHRPDHDVSPATAEQWRNLFLDSWREATGRNFENAKFHLLAARSRLQLARGMLRHLRPWWAAVTRESVLRALGDLAMASSHGGAS